MPRFKDYDYNQARMLPVSFEHQIQAGTFEYNLAYLVDHELDLSIFHHRYKNEEGGAPAYDPAILLKIILLAYSRGITSSRKIEELCKLNILFIAISADSQPHFSTIADFISSSAEEISKLFLQVLMVCDAEGLIGKEMFAIDGCKLPSNAGKEWSGTFKELDKKRKKIDTAVRRMLKKHREADSRGLNQDIIERENRQCAKLKKASKKIRQFLKENEIRTGVSGKEVKSNLTDNESAKMKTSRGVIQGYTGVVTADAKHQVIVQAEAHGQGQEHGLLTPSIEQAFDNLNYKNSDKGKTKITADSGYHNQATLEAIEREGIDAYIADGGFRSRDPRFKDYDKHKPKERLKAKNKFTIEDFKVEAKNKTCICPAGKNMWLKNEKGKIGHYLFMQFQAYESDCPNCPLKSKCLRNPEQSTPRQVNIKLGITENRKNAVFERMKNNIECEEGRHYYSQRRGIVEPVFGNITEMIGIKRFSHRGKKKVNAQWRLMAMIHNIFKIHRYGWSI